MKLNSAFAKGATCPSCKKYVIGQANQPDPPWKCVFCSAKICSYCFSTHTETEHPEKYGSDELLEASRVVDAIRAIREVTESPEMKKAEAEAIDAWAEHLASCVADRTD